MNGPKKQTFKMYHIAPNSNVMFGTRKGLLKAASKCQEYHAEKITWEYDSYSNTWRGYIDDGESIMLKLVCKIVSEVK